MISDSMDYEFVNKIKSRRVKTPITLQIEAVECGAVALKMVLDYYKCFVSIDDLRYSCDVSRDGSKASNIMLSARDYGMESVGIKCELEDIVDVKLPAIVFWNFNHYVVLDGFDKKFVYLNDPAMGKRKIAWEEFDEGFTGIVLTFEPTDSMLKLGRDHSIFASATKRLKKSRTEIVFLIFWFCRKLPKSK
jgi:ABC-type bacteriocin/lantibiotic exporter with double-glycine peptidase domain